MEPETRASIDIRLLGPVEALVGGSPVALGGRRQEALLALLAVRAGRILAADWLIDELWAGEPPDGAAVTLRSYVSRLRAALGTAAAITGGDRRYALVAPPGSIDIGRFESLAAEGDEAQARRDPRRAADSFRRSLLEWRGAAFGDLANDGALEIERRRLEELRLHVLESRLDADLAAGRAAELVDELEALVRQHPFREVLWYHLMLALYRAGRQADALAAYHRARTALDEELGIEPGEQLRSLEAAILRHEVPPPAAVPLERGHALPAPVSSFVGREAELRDLGGVLDRERLVTLTGVGGVGKTRLALEAARRAAPDLRDGAVFVDLSSLTDPELVARHVATSLGLREHGDADMVDLLAADLADRELLLVLDNCEHVVDAAGAIVEPLLTACPRLRVLATSRSALGIRGEIDVPVAPMGLTTPDRVSEGPSDAVQLFLARARAARPAFADDAATLAVAARICADLEGLPLAIELAAARAKSLTLDDIATRLDDRFRFLVSWRRLSTARHRTLREAMDWSYELLGPPEQELLLGLSVFVGGFSLQAVAAVCLAGEDERALELVDRLVDASLVIAEAGPGETRYRLLDTVRQYAGQRLAERGRGADGALRRAHADWCLALAEAAATELAGARQAWWFARLEAEHGNLRAALAHLSASGESRLALRLTIPLTRFWYVRGYLAEGRTWLGQALDADRDHDPMLRRRALTAAASIALLQGEYADATGFAEESLEVARVMGESRFEANALSNLGAIVLAAGDVARAAGLLDQAVAVARTAGDERILALAVNNRGDLELTRGDYERARPLFEESLGLLRARGDTTNIARALFNLGACELQLGDTAAAERLFQEGLTFARDAGDQEDLAWTLEGLAAVAAATGRADRAAVLLGAAGALLGAMGADYKPFERSLRERTEQATRAALGDDRFGETVGRGAGMASRDAIDLALEVVPAA